MKIAPKPNSANEFRCGTETTQSTGAYMIVANPRGDYETALNNTAEERQALELRIKAKEQERAQWQQRLDQRCLGDRSFSMNSL